MNQFLRDLTPHAQIGALFALIFGLLSMLSIGSVMWSVRLGAKRDDDSEETMQQWALSKHVSQILRATWVMVMVFWLVWLAGRGFAVVLFGLMSFFCLREFISMSPTRRSDHRGLVLVFFGVLPVQYVLAYGQFFDLFSVFIPVYVFLLIPVVSVLGNDPLGFFERNAKLQWAVMVFVFGMSHLPALLMLNFRGFEGKSGFLLLFLVLVVQTCMLVQHLVARYWRSPKRRLDQISDSFSLRSMGCGVLAGTMLGVLLSGVTPFQMSHAFAQSLIACSAACMGHVVLKAMRRDVGLPKWSSSQTTLTGASGLVTRMAPLCFAAPVFFHSVRWYFEI